MAVYSKNIHYEVTFANLIPKPLYVAITKRIKTMWLYQIYCWRLLEGGRERAKLLKSSFAKGAGVKTLLDECK